MKGEMHQTVKVKDHIDEGGGISLPRKWSKRSPVD